MCVAVLAPLWPFITQDTWPQLFEIGYHHIPMRDWPEWLARGQTIGWDHSWFNGHPTYQFYFPGPALGWMILDVILPSHTAYILLTVLPIPMMVVAVFWLARTWSLERSSALLLAATAVLSWAAIDLVVFGPRRYGVFNVLYGIFAHGWSVSLSICYLAAVNRLVARRQGRWWVVSTLTLAAAFLSHPLPAVLAGIAVLLLVGRASAVPIITVSLASVGLTAFWWVPMIGQAWMSANLDSDVLYWRFTPILNWMMAGFLPVAVWGAWRLYKRVPNVRLLRPALFLVIVPPLQALVMGQGVFWSGGRLLSFWHIAITAVAAWGVCDWIRERLPMKAAVWVVPGLCGIAVVLYMFTLVVQPYGSFLAAKNRDAHVADNNQPFPDCVPDLSALSEAFPSTLLVDETGWWRPSSDCRLWVLNGINTPLWAHHRNSHGVLLESSPTRPFAERAAPGAMMTLGVDFYLTPDPPPEGSWVERLPDPGGGVALLRINPPPAQWPSEWQGLGAGEWLEGSLERFEQWDDPSDIVIPVRGAPPSGASRNPPLWTVRPDWSDDRYITFHAPAAGFYYVPVSYHPNWNLTTPGEGPWQAGPNQTAVYVSREGKTTLRFDPSRWERLGQVLTLLTGLAAGAHLLRRRSAATPQDTSSGSIEANQPHQFGLDERSSQPDT